MRIRVRTGGKRAVSFRVLAFGSSLAALLLAGCARKETPLPEAPPASATSAATIEPSAPATTESTTAEPVPATTRSAPAAAAAPPMTKTPPPPATKRAQGLPGAPGKGSEPSSPSPAPPNAPRPAAGEPSPAPATSAVPVPAPAAPEKAASKVDDPGGIVAVVSTNSSATRVGPEKCKICHKLQFASWSEGPHARRAPPLDCESCHGPGSEYKTLGTMKDLEKAKAAGLVLPDARFCATCHKRDWSSDMLSKAHAHKAKPAS